MDRREQRRARHAVRHRYRALGLREPPGLIVTSPFAAALAAGFAAGVRWLERHPEVHVPLFGRALDLPALHEMVRAAAHAHQPRDLAEEIHAAVAIVTTAPAAPLPVGFGPRRPLEPARRGVVPGGAVVFDDTPHIAAAEGALPHDPAQDTHLDPRYGSAVDLALAWDVTCPPPCFLRDTAAVWVARPPRSRALHLHADFWFAAERPQVTTDAQGRLHRVDGPAARWRDGEALSFLHGTLVCWWIVRGRIRLTDIAFQPNIEVRRTMIALYEADDSGRFLRDVGAEVLHTDVDRAGRRRRLLRAEIRGDEPYVAVEVTNATPEPDGSRKRYVLRVPPWIRTCRAAVAWTFGVPEDAYVPEQES